MMFNLHDWLDEVIREFEKEGAFVFDVSIGTSVETERIIGVSNSFHVGNRISVDVSIYGTEPTDVDIDLLELTLVSSVLETDCSGQVITKLTFHQKTPQYTWEEL